MQGCTFLSIITPSYNRKILLKKTVESLLEQSYPKDKYEIIIVDDGSTDGTEEMVKGLQEARPYGLKYLYQENKGPAAARNLGIKHARSEIIAFIDSDSIASKVWLEEITKGYYDERVAGIGGLTKAIPTNSRVSQYCAYIRMNERPEIGKSGIAYLITGNCSFRKDCLDKIGGFDERYTFPGGEDPELCHRLKEQGYIFMYNRNAIVYNPHKQTVGELVKTHFNYGKGEMFLILQKYSNRNFASVNGIRRFVYLLRIIIKAFFMLLDNLKSILAIIKVPFKILFYYGEGLAIKNVLIYASLDYVRSLAYKEGSYIGYFIAKSGSPKKALWNNEYNTEDIKE